MFKKVNPKQDFIKLEHEILDFWEKSKIFSKLQTKNHGKKQWSFIDGPITANNPMGVHHAWGRTLKDVFQRYKAMQGFDQRYQNGFDCQGLHVEVETEKDLGFNSKKEIEKFGLANFSRACRERVEKFSAVQTEQSIRLGQWMDWSNSYYTFSDDNIEAIWDFLERCKRKGWLYKGYSVMPWCTRCGTALSQHELSDEGWKEVEHEAVYIKLKVKNSDEYFLVWTTTPWTLPANVALAVNPKLTYVKVFKDGETYILAKDLVEKVLNGAEVREEIFGKSLVGLEYEGMFDELPIVDVDHKVIEWDEVGEDEGTGIVHIAPGCGEEDYQLSKINDLKVIAPLDEYGNYLSGFDWLTGKNVHGIKNKIISSLKKKGNFFKTEIYRHRYPFCWRCKEELVFRAVSEWFIKVAEIREPMKEAGQIVKWMPESIGKRMQDWLDNMGDWVISRKRYWGLPLPFYECECGEVTVVQSRKELLELSNQEFTNFILTRHGESEMNVENKIDSKMPGSDLTWKGEKQARLLGNQMKKRGVDIIYTSPFARCKETAEKVGEICGVKVIEDKRIREQDFGKWDGDVVSKIKKELIEFFDSLKSKQDIKAGQTGETLKEVLKRCDDFYKDILKKNKDKNVVVVAHDGILAGLEKIIEEDNKFRNVLKVSAQNGQAHEYNILADGKVVPELHRPWIDEIKIVCPKCGREVERVKDVGDCWLDAGIVPFSTLGYFYDKKYWAKWFPAEFVCEMRAQVRLWFYSMLFMAVTIEDETPYKGVLSHEEVRDEKGKPMHKSIGNAIWFDEAAEKMGVDVMRWMYCLQNPANNLRFGYRSAEAIKRKLILLWNVYSFFVLYARIDKWEFKNSKLQITNHKPCLSAGRSCLSCLTGRQAAGRQITNYKLQNKFDQWILSVLNSLIADVNREMDRFDTLRMMEKCEKFLDDLANWYVRRSRRRFWKSENDEDKEQAYQTLYIVLVEFVKLLSPVLPFVTEEIYGNLVSGISGKVKSVHLCDYPKADVDLIDDDLNKEMELVRVVANLGLAARARAGIKVRQPLARLKIKDLRLEISSDLLDILEDEVNVKEVEFVDEVDQEKGWQREGEGDVVVALQIELSEELELEGMAREIVRCIQSMRKKVDYDIADRIKVWFEVGGKLKKVFDRFGDYIKKETLAEELSEGREDDVDFEKEVDVNGERVWLGIKK